MKNELLPCPFCGGEAGIQPRDKNDYLPHCKKCPCMLKPLIPYKTEEEAISAWNTRTEPELKPLTLDELRERERKWIETCGNQWVWIKVLKNAYMPYQKYTGWLCVIKRFADDVCNFGTHLGGTSVAFDEAEYGKTWIAYDREVKGDNDGQIKHM